MTSLWTRCIGVVVFGGWNINASLENLSNNSINLMILLMSLRMPNVWIIFSAVSFFPLLCSSKMQNFVPWMHQTLSRNINNRLTTMTRTLIITFISHLLFKDWYLTYLTLTGACFNSVHVCMRHVSIASQFIWNFKHESCWHRPPFQKLTLCQLATLFLKGFSCVFLCFFQDLSGLPCRLSWDALLLTLSHATAEKVSKWVSDWLLASLG